MIKLNLEKKLYNILYIIYMNHLDYNDIVYYIENEILKTQLINNSKLIELQNGGAYNRHIEIQQDCLVESNSKLVSDILTNTNSVNYNKLQDNKSFDDSILFIFSTIYENL